jgi:hypothetical protein
MNEIREAYSYHWALKDLRIIKGTWERIQLIEARIPYK